MEALLDHLARLLSVPSWCCVFSVRPEPEPLPERRESLFQFRISLRQGDHDANPARLLRARRERPGGCSAVEQRDERASFHSHLVGLLSSRERIAHLGGAGDPALRNFNPAYVSLGSIMFSNGSRATAWF